MTKDEKYDRITALHAKGMSNREIGRELYINTDAVKYVLKKLGLTPHRPMAEKRVNVTQLWQLWCDPGLTVTEVARKMGITTGYLYRLARHFALPSRDRKSRNIQEATPEDEAASCESLALSPYVQARIVELRIGFPEREAV